MLRVWMQDSVSPTSQYITRPGRWVGESSWPSTSPLTRNYLLASHQLMTEPDDVTEEALTIQSPLSLGLFAGKWCSYAAGPDLAHDQRQEDGGALVFDSEPLVEPIEILGAPELSLEVSSNKPVAMIAVRLSDVLPDGKVTRVTYGLLNLTHRNSSEHPEYLEPQKRYLIQMKLNYIAQTFPAQHRIRVSISTSYWPLAWPSPEPVQLTLFTGKSQLCLPVRPLRTNDEQLFFELPEGSPKTPAEIIEPTHHNWLVHRDLALDRSTLEVINDNGMIYLAEIDLEVGIKAQEWYSSQGDDYDSVKGETRITRRLKRKNWAIKTITHTILTSNALEFHIKADIDAFENEARVYCHNWNIKIPRDFV